MSTQPLTRPPSRGPQHSPGPHPTPAQQHNVVPIGSRGNAARVRRGDRTDQRGRVHLEVVIPALNEETRLARTLLETVEHLERQDYSSAVVVVDNGSVDRTSELARSFGSDRVPVHVIGCARTGKGSAVRRGFAGSRADFVGFMDADLATPVATLDTVMTLLESGAGAVIASRHARDALRAVRQGTLRRLGGGAFRLAARSVLPAVTDSQCGFKFFSTAAVQSVLGECTVDGFSFDLELLGRVQREGWSILEVPVVWTDVSGSSFHPLRHGARSFSDAVRVHRLVSGIPRTQPPIVFAGPATGPAVAAWTP